MEIHDKPNKKIINMRSLAEKLTDAKDLLGDLAYGYVYGITDDTTSEKADMNFVKEQQLRIAVLTNIIAAGGVLTDFIPEEAVVLGASGLLTYMVTDLASSAVDMTKREKAYKAYNKL